jgi:hypothetical protein
MKLIVRYGTGWATGGRWWSDTLGTALHPRRFNPEETLPIPGMLRSVLVCMYVSIHVGEHICVSVCLSVCLSVCIYVYVCMCRCMYTCIYACVCKTRLTRRFFL